MLIQSRMSLLHPARMSFQYRDNKGCFGWEVMMDTRFSNVNHCRNIGKTEGREPSFHQQLVGRV